MALFKKNMRQRRLEVRKNIPAQQPWFIRMFQRRGSIASMAILLMFFVGAASLDLWPGNPLKYRPGQYVSSDITARVDFRIPWDEQLREATRNAREQTEPTFRLNTALIDEIVTSLEKIPGRLQAAKTLDKVPKELRDELGLKLPPKPAAKRDPKKTPTTKPAAKPKPTESQRVFEAWAALAKPDARKTWDSKLSDMREALTFCYFVHPEQVEGKARYVKLTADDRTVRQKAMDLVGLDETEQIKRMLKPVEKVFSPRLRPGIEAFLLARLTKQPIYLRDETKTAADIEAAVKDIEINPPDTCFKHYHAGDILAGRSNADHAKPRRKGLSLAELELLRAEHEAYLTDERDNSAWRPWLRFVARIGLMVMLTTLLAIYVLHYHPHMIEENIRSLALAIMLLMMLGLTKVSAGLLPLNPNVALLWVCIAGMILTIAYDQRFALACGAILAVFVVLQMRANLGMLVVLLAGLMSVVLQIHEVRTRSRLLMISIFAAVAVFLVVWAMSIRVGVNWTFVFKDSVWAVASTLLAGLIVQGLLPIIERIFNVATGSTLLEWCDASKPLLKRLAMESPGTYNHSLQLGAMCEAAADSINARGLLARVGAYYHDIGKINKPAYFTENQSGENKHEKLSPAMSLLIIHGHVKDGLEMAREYGLPGALREFIATHHGTTLVQYFYHAATKKSETEQTPAPDENQFRYPGPKPQSKEAAILMLADAAESSVRAMSEPTPTRIRTQVNKMVTVRLEDGQLDECDLTLREVHQIQESLIKSLCGMYHSRIAYPSSEAEEKAEGKSEGNGQAKSEQKDAKSPEKPASQGKAQPDEKAEKQPESPANQADGDKGNAPQ